MSNNSVKKTVFVAAALSIACSIVVSTAATVLKPIQEANAALDRKSNILAAAGLLEENTDIEEAFKAIEPRALNLETGEWASDVDLEQYDQFKAAKTAEGGRPLTKDEDIAGIGRQELVSKVYLVRDESGALSKVVVPVRGYGLWSTLYGFMAIEADGNTVAGLGFYEHAETPGLGGEVDNPKWKGQWPGKKIYDEQGEVELSVVKGQGKGPYEIDGLSGATLTARGVDNMIHFWLGEQGYSSFLKKLRSGTLEL